MAETWYPLGSTPEDHGVLHEGVPPWLTLSLRQWIRAQIIDFVDSRSFSQPIPTLDRALLRQMERTLKTQIPYTGSDLDRAVLTLEQAFEPGPRRLVLVDYLVSRTDDESAAFLGTLLEESGSAWTTGTRLGGNGLVRRVPEGVQVAAEAVMASSTSAGARLSEAWRAAFGVSPDPGLAYSKAIKAVEDAAIPVVLPADTTATLGKVIGNLRANGASLPFQRDGRQPDSEVLVGMLDMLWAGQVDRHGGSPGAHTQPVNQAAAEAAVLLAVPLVHWFVVGAVKP